MVNKILKEIDNLKEKLTKYRPLNQTELRVLRDNFIYEASYNSNAIEGNSLTLKETVLLLKDGVTVSQKPIRDYLDMIGLKEAFDYIFEMANTNTPITEQEIKNIHSLVLNADKDNKGVYRKIPVIITGANHTPPQPYLITPKVEQLLKDYETWKTKDHIIEAISRFHLEFEYIHPFIDGNGRTGRLLLNFELIKNGFLPIDIKFTDREKYYQAFEDYQATNEPNKMIELVAKYEKEELTKRINILENM